MSASIAKPQLRGLLKSTIKMNLAVSIGLGIVSGIAFKFLVCDARKQRYADFYKNYDPEEAYKQMVKAGADFQSASAQ